MTTRQAACDPCRRAKLACDHKRPVCTRCEQSRRAHTCTYRAAPFRRKQHSAPAPPSEPDSRTSSRPQAALAASSPQRTAYPNPGFLGSSSHVAIFNHVLPQRNQETEETHNEPSVLLSQRSPSGSVNPDSPLIRQAAIMLGELLGSFDLGIMRQFVEFWLATGTNLALADSFVKPCVQCMEHVHTELSTQDTERYSRFLLRLLQNSAVPLRFHQASTELDFIDQICGSNIRLETLGIFLCAVVRATFDVPFFPQLYTTAAVKQRLRELVTLLNKYVLELCLSLDCLNDVQLMFQYETFIVNSYVDGNHNLSSFRSLGDVVTSVFALGYHEDIQNKADVPAFIIKLRTTVFARIYSADKNIALFLGRPPRMSKRFCYFQLPSEQMVVGGSSQLSFESWPADAKMNYTSESRWSALCASIKEEVMELFYTGGNRDNHLQKVSELSSQAEKYWQALPNHFRLQGSLKQYSNQTPFERDFLVSARLNYLHVQFLLRFVVLARLAEPDNIIIETAREILSLTVETVLLRDHLVNSGTGVTWRIAHYGLPAAGIVLLAILDRHEPLDVRRSLQSRVWQDLSVLAAEIQVGSILQQNDPNHALLSRATQTIQDFLNSLSFERDAGGQSERPVEQRDVGATEEWSDRWNPDPWNLEIEFWESLAEHPFIAGTDDTF